ncbi:MAG TPA: hypothetical protein PKA00_23540, partial [Saprospiraceae bacterium]|nr:hypothetical protein [Saprospiraceae bacterium]HMQ85903.1 hypothetical protein [Saprospiraceae bacterium]
SGQVYISPVKDQNQVAVPIANTIHVNLKFNFNSGSLAEHWDNHKVPKFCFSLATGAADIDLTNALKSTDGSYDPLTSAWNIGADLGNSETDQWTNPKQIKTGSSPTWEVYPQSSNQGLFSSDTPNLDVVFTHVISILPAGQATLYVQWSNIPGYNDGFKALDLPKAAAVPQILSFQGPEGTPNFGDTVQLSWKTFAIPALNLRWDGESRAIKAILGYDQNKPQLYYEGSTADFTASEKQDFMLDKQHTTFRLLACDANGQELNSVFQKVIVAIGNFPAPTIDRFSSQIDVDENGYAFGITLNWLVRNLGDEGYLQLNGVRLLDGKNYNGFPGTITNTIDNSRPIQLDNLLTAFDTTNNLNADKTIVTPIPANLKPVITVFTGSINRDSNGMATELVLNWHVKNAVKSASKPTYNTSCNINGSGSFELDDNGNGTARFPINKQAPILSYYQLSVTTPGAVSVSKRLRVNFQKKLPLSNPSDLNGATPWSIASDGDTNILVLYAGGNSGNGESRILYFDFSKRMPDGGNDSWYNDFRVGISPPANPAGRRSFYCPSVNGNNNPQPYAIGLDSSWYPINVLCSFGIGSYSNPTLIDNQKTGVDAISFATFDALKPFGGELWCIYTPSTVQYVQDGPHYINSYAGVALQAYSMGNEYVGAQADYPAPDNSEVTLGEYPHELIDIGISPNGTVFISDKKAGKIWYNSRDYIQRNGGGLLTSWNAIDVENAGSIAISDTGWVYCLQGVDSGASAIVHYFKESSPGSTAELAAWGDDNNPHQWTLYAAHSFLFLLQLDPGFIGIFSAATDEAAPTNISWTHAVDGLAGVAMIPDNTRFYAAGSAGIDVWEAYLEPEA